MRICALGFAPVRTIVVEVSLYVSRRTRRIMVAIALTGIAAAFGLLVSQAGARPEGTPLSFTLGVGCMLLAASFVLFVATMRYARLPDDECSFCGTPRLRAKFLVAGKAVAICEVCAPLSVANIAEDLADKTPPGPWHVAIVDSLPWRCPVSLSRPLVQKLVEESTDPAALRRAAATARKLQHPDLAVEALSRIPEAGREAGAWLDLGLSLGAAGRYAEAVAATSTALAKGDAALRPWCLNNRAWFSVRHRPDAPIEERTTWLREVEEAKRLVSETRSEGWQVAMQCFLGTEAELRQALGDQRGALQTLTEAEGLGPFSGAQHLVRARVLAAGDPPLGRLDAKRALELLHPDSPDAREARALLARLGPTGA
jgi:hypothetical protein